MQCTGHWIPGLPKTTPTRGVRWIDAPPTVTAMPGTGRLLLCVCSRSFTPKCTHSHAAANSQPQMIGLIMCRLQIETLLLGECMTGLGTGCQGQESSGNWSSFCFRCRNSWHFASHLRTHHYRCTALKDRTRMRLRGGAASAGGGTWVRAAENGDERADSMQYLEGRILQG